MMTSVCVGLWQNATWLDDIMIGGYKHMNPLIKWHAVKIDGQFMYGRSPWPEAILDIDVALIHH